ncbi:cytoplasmic dynein light chain [Cavenderia fasciculata]|uniref:Cytoplasmic dynein light chain n=1 Tax=Cavenderia fasciculata TaxID=261658 RepID=F4PYB4_CACFS|nr:cytoplasmic dynein light chain [Cavenderia fasciculata]EGG19381.1 cytoplasmic dynein light chain [Cavenderia fasciculata]|eukprot:XP_004357652.1 cytoplasmic dynein light chain [Cavenderia fasciculata]
MRTVDRKTIQIKIADMEEFMQQEAVECAVKAFESNDVEKDIASSIKKEN